MGLLFSERGSHEERNFKVCEQLAKGDLAVHIPSVGRVTRNQVQKWLDRTGGKDRVPPSSRLGSPRSPQGERS